MLKNYLKIAWRRLINHKVDSIISIGGLAIGIACCALLLLSVRFEFSFDNFHKNGDRLYRITQSFIFHKRGKQLGLMHAYPLAPALTSSFPAIKHVVRLQRDHLGLKIDDEVYGQKVLLAGPAFFQMFTFPLIAGNKKTALKQPHSIVLTQSMAQKLFHTDHVLGKTIKLRKKGEQRTYTITGVAKDVPRNSSIQFNVIVPITTMFWGMPEKQAKYAKNSWAGGNNLLWIMLQKSASAKNLEAQFPTFVKKHYRNWKHTSLGLQPLSEAHFSQQFKYTIAQHTNIRYTIILAIIAVIILAIAGFNFISLTLSRIVGRRGEMGIRKSVGALRWQLSLQLLGEIFITCGISLVVGMILAQMAAPAYRHIIQKPLPVQLFANPAAWGIMAGILLVVTLITGIYPAWFIYCKSPTILFRSQRSAERIPRLVKGLIVTQFVLSIAFLITTVTMQNQMNFMLHGKDLGFSPKKVLSISFPSRIEQAGSKAKQFKQQAKRLAGVQAVSLSGASYNEWIPHGAGMAGMITSSTLTGLSNMVHVQYNDANYLQTMHIKLVKGHNFSQNRTADLKDGIIVNQQFVQALGLHHPVGHVIHDDKSDIKWDPFLNDKKIIGVMTDFNFQSLFHKVNPLVLKYLNVDSQVPGSILVKFGSGSEGATIKKLKNLWNKVLPHETFNYRFLDDLLASQYKSQQRWSLIMKIASAIAVSLACFGLFGLAMLTVRSRTKEIGIRKVLGASEVSIVRLLSKDFLKLVVIGFVIAVPIGWYAMHYWLQNFAYKITMSWWIFLLAGGIALIIALATVSWQSVRAALANPVDSLRSE
jgi:putative ABC transport system permease protein